MIALLTRIFGGGLLDRVLATVDKHVEAQTDRERIKADLTAEYLRTRADYMRAGGLWLMLMFAAPLALWWAAVLIYSVLWCARCAWPQAWSIAALPSPLNDWAGLIVVSIFGVIGLTGVRK